VEPNNTHLLDTAP